jgi:hypothetical protein
VSYSILFLNNVPYYLGIIPYISRMFHAHDTKQKKAQGYHKNLGLKPFVEVLK